MKNTTKYRLINKTKISRKLLKKIIEFCCPNKVSGFSILFRNKPKLNHGHADGLTWPDKNKIVSIGWNNNYRTHPLAKRYGYRFDSIHSEMSAILRYEGNPKDLRDKLLSNMLRHVMLESFGRVNPMLVKSILEADFPQC